jgi:hypothetical protein
LNLYLQRDAVRPLGEGRDRGASCDQPVDQFLDLFPRFSGRGQVAGDRQGAQGPRREPVGDEMKPRFPDLLE